MTEPTFTTAVQAIADGPLLPVGLDEHAYGEFVAALQAANSRADLTPDQARTFDQVAAMLPKEKPWQPAPVPGDPATAAQTKAATIPPPPKGYYVDVDWTDAVLDGPYPEYASGRKLTLPDSARQKPESGSSV